MNDKKIMLIMSIGMVILLCLSVLIVLSGDKKSERETTVVIQQIQETEEITASEEAATEEYIYININEATAEELEKLEGIGEETAYNIIVYRGEIGGFANINEIKNVNGIGESKFEAIKEHIYVENPYERESGTETETAVEPTQEAEHEITSAAEAVTEPITVQFPLDLNTATKEELMQLPHVTEETADRIIWFREETGGYSHVYELLYIEELEQKEVAEIIEFVTVGQ